ncbi:MAG: hypothetical protein ACFE0Q_11240 [Anaerolineae bacterium]
MMRWIRVGWLVMLVLLVGVVSAQTDLGWVRDLIPTASDINLSKQLEQSTIDVSVGEIALDESFTAPDSWQSLTDVAGNRFVRDGRYEMRLIQPDLIYTSLSTQTYDNAIITVETERLSQEPNDGYGVVCRASDENNGMHFYISSDGFWRIFAFVDERARPFMPWTASETINQGENARNILTAVCVNDYFALYINGELAGEVRDGTFLQGQVGMSMILFEEQSEVSIAFDNLRVWSASSDAEVVSVMQATPQVDDDPFFMMLDQRRDETITLLEDGQEAITINDLLRYDALTEPLGWSVISGDMGAVSFGDDGATLTSDAGVDYPILLVSEDAYDGVVVQADLQFEEGAINNAFGLVCRSSTSDLGRGYQFVISGDGYYTIWLTDGVDYRFLITWERTSTIQRDSINRMTVVCVEDYMGFYLNGRLLHELYNDVYLSGTVGVGVYSFEEDESSTITASEIFIWEAELP